VDDGRRKAVLKVVTQVAVALVVAGIASGETSVWILTGVVVTLACAGWVMAAVQARRV
jgi:hypothetical protein